MTLNLAERVLNGEALTKEECLSLFQDETIDTFELLNEAYIVRKHYYGKKVKLNMSGRLWLLWSICQNERKTTLCFSGPRTN